MKKLPYVFKKSKLSEDEFQELLKTWNYQEYLIPWTDEKTWIYYDVNEEKISLMTWIANLLDENSYASSYSWMAWNMMLTDIVFVEKRNSTKYWFKDRKFWIYFNKIDELKEEDFIFDWYKKYATKERAVFDFLVEAKNFIDFDDNIHQFWWLSYRIENVWDINQHKIREYCENTWDEKLIYLWEFFWKFVEFHKKHNLDVWDEVIDYGEMKNLKYFNWKEYYLEDYLKLKFY